VTTAAVPGGVCVCYGGGSYTITSVKPGGGSFTVSRDGGLFVNQGTAITDGVGWLSCPA